MFFFFSQISLPIDLFFTKNQFLNAYSNLYDQILMLSTQTQVPAQLYYSLLCAIKPMADVNLHENKHRLDIFLNKPELMFKPPGLNSVFFLIFYFHINNLQIEYSLQVDILF